MDREIERSVERKHHLGSGESVTKCPVEGRLACGQVRCVRFFGSSGPLIVAEVVRRNHDLCCRGDPGDASGIDDRSQRFVGNVEDEPS